MKSSDNTSPIGTVIASGADSTYVNTIPTAQATTGDGSVSLDLGFPPECAISVAAGGKRPEMKDVNGVWKLLSSAIQSLQAYRGVYNADFSAAIGGYPNYAVVSDSSGVLWVSTADSNTTVPGATDADWKLFFDGYATESWSSDTFVGRAASVYDYTPLQAGVNKSTGEIWLSYANSSGTVEYVFAQTAGDYALQTALTTEVTRAESAETALSNNKVNRAGDTMTGNLSLNNAALHINNGSIYLVNPSGEDVQIYTDISGSGLSNNDLVFRTGNGSNPIYTSIGNDGRIYSSAKGDVAFQSELPTSGTLTGTGSVITGYWTKTAGILRQTFTVEVSPDSDGNATVYFPIAFSAVPTVQATGSVELQQVHTGGAANQSSSTALKVTTTQAPLHFWTGANTSSVVPSIVTITAEGPA